MSISFNMSKAPNNSSDLDKNSVLGLYLLPKGQGLILALEIAKQKQFTTYLYLDPNEDLARRVHHAIKDYEIDS